MRQPRRPSEYPSLLLYILDETHVTVTVTTALVVLWTRSAHATYFGAGALSTTLLAKLAKRFIQQPRPAPSAMSRASPVRPKRTYGMPSTHSAALSFYFFYLFPLLPLLPRLSPAYSQATALGPWTWIERGALTALWALTLWSRVELGYHTPAQVVGGAAFGLAGALAWTAAWRSNPWLESALAEVIDEVWMRTVGRVF
ncbi:hypothetical protein Q5752_005150 [Cryptotrichosporon argae]